MNVSILNLLGVSNFFFIVGTGLVEFFNNDAEYLYLISGNIMGARSLELRLFKFPQNGLVFRKHIVT